MTKEEIEKMIFENPMYKNALNDIPKENQPQMIEEIKKIIDGFYNNILIPIEKINSR